ncbi:MAG: hypothetical protein LBN00_11735 [Oscillospiraceae bacterium]|jgi:hypothetical protein|nr:hypothetical protein [Oscillospiraceae bacterium]
MLYDEEEIQQQEIFCQEEIAKNSRIIVGLLTAITIFAAIIAIAAMLFVGTYLKDRKDSREAYSNLQQSWSDIFR